jgi:hypothetical protein
MTSFCYYILVTQPQVNNACRDGKESDRKSALSQEFKTKGCLCAWEWARRNRRHQGTYGKRCR